MEKYFVFLSLVLLAVGVAQAQNFHYDCRRSNQACFSPVTGGLCNFNTGQCDCRNPNFRGFDCTLPTAQVRPIADCTVNCTGRGTCYNDGTGDRCYCDAAYYGPQCEMDRVSVQCFPNYMIVRAFPPDFIGLVYVSNLPPFVDARCQFEPALDGNGLTKNLSFSEDLATNPCRPNLSVATSQLDGTLIFTYDITVKYHPFYSTILDQSHSITCRHILNGPLIGTVVAVDAGPTDGLVITGNSSIISLTITRESDGAIVSDTDIVTRTGDFLNVEVTVLAPSRYRNHKVENCGAYNFPLDDIANPSRLEKPLVSNGCPAPNSQDVLRGGLRKVGPTVYIPFRSFRFNTGELHVYCSVRVCRSETDELCFPEDCNVGEGGPGGGFGRRKRASDDHSDQINMTASFFVLPTGRVPDEVTDKPVEQSCFRSVTFLSFTAVFAVLLLIALVATIVLWFKYKTLSTGKYSAKA